MGRPVLVVSAGNMNPVLYCYLVCLSIAPHTATAADIDIYPGDELAKVVFLNHIMAEIRREQLPPQFTYHFPEEQSQFLKNDLFAVPPSDPRYYQPDIDVGVRENKRAEEDPYESLSESESDQVVSPTTAREENWSDGITSEINEPLVGDNTEEVSYVFKKVLEYDENIVFVAIVAGCGAAAAFGVLALFIGWYKLHNNSKAAADIEYPAYGVTGPNKEISPTGDRRLAHSAQMYHYQHQKQQIIAMESNRANNERRGSVSEGDSEEENEEGDYTVYECPGLAATGELEVKNPLFLDDPTPAAGNHVEEPPAAAEQK